MHYEIVKNQNLIISVYIDILYRINFSSKFFLLFKKKKNKTLVKAIYTFHFFARTFACNVFLCDNTAPHGISKYLIQNKKLLYTSCCYVIIVKGLRELNTG